MTFETALRLTELLLAWAIILQSIEHLFSDPGDRILFVPRLAFGAWLIIGLNSYIAVWALWILGLCILKRFNGPYNGGSDTMTMLILSCLSLAHLAPHSNLAELSLAYLAIQLTLSYFVSGWVKLVNPDWRRGTALRDAFGFSAYPVSLDLRSLAHRPGLMLLGSWAVILLELAFPLALLHPLSLYLALACTAAFHLATVIAFGLNRFFWIWPCAYPSILWFQERLILV